MNRCVIPLIATIATSLGASQLQAQTVSAIQFARGATSATLSGSLKGQNYIDYRVGVSSGQNFSVTLRSKSGSPYFNVMEPGEKEEAIYNSSSGDQRYTGVTRHSGAYTIRVYQMRASGRRGEVASFQLVVSVTGRASDDNRPSHASGDALVPGTPYHATTMIRCRTAEGMAMSTCKAGVIRRSAGSATVHLNTPDGGERTILFRSGAAVSSDGEERMQVDRRDDTSIVRIGNVEVYEIPDALIFGG